MKLTLPIAKSLKKKQKAFDILTQIEAEGKLETLSFKEIKILVTNQHTDLMTLEFGNEIVRHLKESGKHGNARVYDMMLKSINKFKDGKDFPMINTIYRYIFFPGLFFIFFSYFGSFLVVWGLGFWGWGLLLGFWGWGFQLVGFGACGVGPSGFFGLGLYINITE